MDLLVDTSDELDGRPREVRRRDRGPAGKNEKLHAPPIVDFVWAEQVFHGVLQSLDVTYVLFHTDGKPLRAKLAVSAEGVPAGRGPGREDQERPRPTSRSATSCAPARRSARSRPRSSATRRGGARSPRQRDHRPAPRRPRHGADRAARWRRRAHEHRGRHAHAGPARRLLRARSSSSRSRARSSTPSRRATSSRSRSRCRLDKIDERRPQAQQLRRHDVRPEVDGLRALPPRQPGAREARLRRPAAVDDARRHHHAQPGVLPRTARRRSRCARWTRWCGSRAPSPPETRSPTELTDCEIAQKIAQRHKLRIKVDEGRARRSTSRRPAQPRRRDVPEGARGAGSTSRCSCAPTPRPARTSSTSSGPATGASRADPRPTCSLGHPAQHRRRAEPDRVQADDHAPATR